MTTRYFNDIDTTGIRPDSVKLGQVFVFDFSQKSIECLLCIRIS
ncbi:Uncharacterised protein [BD1-7 clade bacterium]|uniref:Uncharacterized protein n=1 Tax=BD1-7 clade bacterium TaxID=2029982 RepID=A0A5S9Q672_9GAMM|nr:Uncharacterised protein [BD1-7 clade bacterium]CAA0112530.1 Uncharacterised protein [BD1-7 clade bacterium]